MDIVTVGIFLATLAVLVGGYLVWIGIGRGMSEAQRLIDLAQCRIRYRDNASGFAGSQNKPGVN
jgi:hypothetical protein